MGNLAPGNSFENMSQLMCDGLYFETILNKKGQLITK